MVFCGDFRKFGNQFRNACHGGLVHSAVLTLIDSHLYVNVILNSVNQAITLHAEFNFVVNVNFNGTLAHPTETTRYSATPGPTTLRVALQRGPVQS